MAEKNSRDILRKIDADGRTILRGEDAAELLLRGYDLSSLLIEPNPEVDRYNQLCAARDKAAFQIPSILPAAETIAERIATWLMPDAYQHLPVRETLLARCVRQDEIERVNQEMDMFEARDLLPVLRLMFYLVDQFRQHGVVWGVGRGSSVASYCLFLIGIHKCDSLFYKLDIHEFLR